MKKLCTTQLALAHALGRWVQRSELDNNTTTMAKSFNSLTKAAAILMTVFCSVRLFLLLNPAKSDIFFYRLSKLLHLGSYRFVVWTLLGGVLASFNWFGCL